ncbi:MAG: 30S ribosomal protein S9 [Parcubacteria group bacterium 21-54-25]|nr:MAG: 30S ribosomal protein S9 [Parcubacteria group bacterium 21-54-25]HQU07817.1 30S ribosomal protein S9 [Candidatus Paceibacterota bacterium]
MTETRYIPAIGRRKTARASVRITPADKTTITVNGKPAAEYFKTDDRTRVINEPFVAAEAAGTYAIEVRVSGGGVSAQADATRHGISRALIKHVAELRAPLKAAGLLTRDSRAVERKKPGLRKARKAPQWSKR